jgi:hypothetical protein
MVAHLRRHFDPSVAISAYRPKEWFFRFATGKALILSLKVWVSFFYFFSFLF